MKGYTVESGYMGYLDGSYMLFADENDYRETYEEYEEQCIEFESVLWHNVSYKCNYSVHVARFCE